MSTALNTWLARHAQTLMGSLGRIVQHPVATAMTMAVIALALALPWTVATLARPRDGARHALAVICALGFGAVLLSVLQAGPDERHETDERRGPRLAVGNLDAAPRCLAAGAQGQCRQSRGKPPQYLRAARLQAALDSSHR